MFIQCLNGQKQEIKNQYKNYNEKGKSKLNLLGNNECLGYIDIPKIDVYLPIYEGTSDDILLKGIGHLNNTSLPIGGKNTNSVLVGHTGITAKTFFDNLTKLEIEDVFYIYVLDDVLKYKVMDIRVVLPEDTENIKVVEAEDLVTLVTCTPKYINSHRLLVIGERVQAKEAEIEDLNSTDIATAIDEYICFIITIIIILTLFIVINKESQNLTIKRMCEK